MGNLQSVELHKTLYSPRYILMDGFEKKRDPQFHVIMKYRRHVAKVASAKRFVSREVLDNEGRARQRVSIMPGHRGEVNGYVEFRTCV